MFANVFQSGFISIFYSVGSSPLSIWDKHVKNGHIRRVIDEEVKSLVLDVSGTNVTTTYITCPIKSRASLGIKLPFLIMIVKNMKKYFTFEVQILDDKNMHRRFRMSNFQSTTSVRPFCTTMPLALTSGWNQVNLNLSDFTRKAYCTTYVETVRVQIHANVRIRRIYFADMMYSDEDLPNEFKLLMPGSNTRPRPTKASITSNKGTSKPRASIKEEPVAAPPTPAEQPSARQEPSASLQMTDVVTSAEVLIPIEPQQTTDYEDHDIIVVADDITQPLPIEELETAEVLSVQPQESNRPSIQDQTENDIPNVPLADGATENVVDETTGPSTEQPDQTNEEEK